MSEIRVVSLVPSLTEAIAVTIPGVLVGATDWCTHPVDLAVTRVGGTKNPDVEAVAALQPDLVVVNHEENRAVDVEALQARGLAVHRTDPETVPAALDQLGELLAALGVQRVGWLETARNEWARPWRGPRRRAVVPIWRRPWMALGRDTFAGDLLARLGVDHVLAASTERYPRFDPQHLPPHDLVVLPDEPYAFAAADGPEAFVRPAALVSGRHLTWYGPSLAKAREILLHQLTPGGATWVA